MVWPTLNVGVMMVIFGDGRDMVNELKSSCKSSQFFPSALPCPVPRQGQFP